MVRWPSGTVTLPHSGRVAQLVRALPSHGRGQGFESLRAHHRLLFQTLRDVRCRRGCAGECEFGWRFTALGSEHVLDGVDEFRFGSACHVLAHFLAEFRTARKARDRNWPPLSL